MRAGRPAATEFGPDGFLPADPAVMAAVPGRPPPAPRSAASPRWCCTWPSHDPAPEIERLLDGYDAARAEVLVLSAATGRDGYDTGPTSTRRAGRRCSPTSTGSPAWPPRAGVRAVLHPHVGTMVENGDEVQRVLEGSAISLCLDTGHLLIGGTDPAELTRQAPDRIAHTHFKDVDDQIAAAGPGRVG